VLLTPNDFVVSYVHIHATAVADGVPAFNSSDHADLEVTRAVTVDVVPHFRKPSKVLNKCQHPATLAAALPCLFAMASTKAQPKSVAPPYLPNRSIMFT
jgi:hypothetical protein